MFHTADQYILQRPRLKAEGGGLLPLGSRADVLSFFARFNTAPDRAGSDTLHGPGIRVEIPPSQDPISQVTVTIVEDELFQILFFGKSDERMGRLLRETLSRGWRFFDPAQERHTPRFADDPVDDDAETADSDD